MTILSTSQTAALIDAALDMRRPLLILGPPGAGKSSLVAQAAQRRGWGFIDMRLSQRDAADLGGIPVADLSSRTLEFLPMGRLPNADRDGEFGILFFDELPQAQDAVQTAAFEIVQDGRSGDYTLPPGWVVLAAGNRMEDRAGARRLNSALADRFSIVEVSADLDSWCRYEIDRGSPAEVVAFMRFRDELFNIFNPDVLINATARSWSAAADIIKAKLPPETEANFLAGTVGSGPAAELVAFLRIWRSLPQPDAVFLDPAGAEVPTDAATLYAICGALARKVTEQSMQAFTAYLDRLPPEYGVLAMQLAKGRDSLLLKTAPGVAWLATHSDVYL